MVLMRFVCCDYIIMINYHGVRAYICPFSAEVLHWYWACVWLPQCQYSNPEGDGLNRPLNDHNKSKASAYHVYNSCTSFTFGSGEITPNTKNNVFIYSRYTAKLRPNRQNNIVYYNNIDGLDTQSLVQTTRNKILATASQYINTSDWAHFVYAPSQWETTLHCNVVSHWLGGYAKWSLEW